LLINNYHKKASINLAIFPIDHYIPEKEQFQDSLKDAFQIAFDYNRPVLIGIKPKKKETRYGYIVVDKQITNVKNIKLYKILKFKEKPDENWIAESEKKFQLFWNTGIYVMPSQFIFQSIKQFLPELDKSMQIISQSIGTLDKSQTIRTQFEKIKAVSFEYAVLEKTLEILAVEGGFVWDDIGSWHAVERFIPMDIDGNIIQGEYLGIDTKNCLIINDNGLTVTIGLDNFVIIKNGPIQMIYPKNREGDIKKIISQMEKDTQFKKYL
ncbi:MAG: sugar phosphate nucleotidyltransferase, partial [Atribacterota bacterium]|nr:sugar phosphate nucleotidyltransferase [Atribacterota bacterium]